MAEGEPLSTTDLFLLAIGLYKLKDSRPEAIATGEEYYLDDKKRSLRETAWNQMWLAFPAWEWVKVRHRDWLLTNIVANLVGGTSDFGALSEHVLGSLDVLSKEFKPNRPENSEVIRQAVEPKSGYKRSFLTALAVGLSEQSSQGRRVRVLGAGIRRRTSVWIEASQALQADVEFFVPFLPLGTGEPPADPSWPNARSINAGIRISRANGSSIGREIVGEDEDGKKKYGKDLAAVRFNFRLPFTAHAVNKLEEKLKEYYVRNLRNVVTAATETMGMPTIENPFPLAFVWEPGDLVTTFGEPSIRVQKLAFVEEGAAPAKWEWFENWEDFVEEFCESPDGNELLNAPIGPLLLETVNDTSSLSDILKSHHGEIKKDIKEAKQELEEAVALFKKSFIPEPGGKNDPRTSLSQRRLGGLLESLGLLKGKGGGGNVEYSPAKLSELTVWDVLNRMLDELDGFPLWVKGVDAKDEDAMRAAVSLASQTALANKNKQYFGLAGLAYNVYAKVVGEKEEKKEAEEETDDPVLVLGRNYFTDDESALLEDDTEDGEKKGAEKKKSGVQVVLHLGKWFEGETLDDNWFRCLLPAAGTEKSPWKRRVPLPGLRLFPFQRTLSEDKKQAVYTLALRGDLLSFGFDIKGKTKEGLKFLQREKGLLTHFGLGAVEVRFALLTAVGRFAFGVGVKLKDMRLSFGDKEKTKEEKEREGQEKKEKQKAAGDEIIAGLQELLGEDDWAATPAPETPEERKPKTRLGGKKLDKFSISIGYLTPLADNTGGTLDVQLYDEKGVRGKTVWIPIDLRALAVYVKDIGIGLKGLENIELGKGLSEDAKLTVAVNGGLRWPAFELGFIGAQLGFSLTEFGDVSFSLDGLDISFKSGSAVVSGSFLKSGLEFGGSLTVELPKLSIAAVGFYGSIALFDMKDEKGEVLLDLKLGRVHPTLHKELADHKLAPSGLFPVRPTFPKGGWLVKAEDKEAKTSQTYTVIKDGGKLHFLLPEKTFFFFGSVGVGSGGQGIQLGPIELTAFAFGFGINRRLVVPPVEKVAEFPFVQMVMGEGGYQFEDESGTLAGQLGEAVEPASLLKDMGDWVKAEAGQTFICAGARFTISKVIDCFALVVVQWGNEFELSLLGLARFRQPSDPSAKPICYVEMQLLMTVKPSEGVFKLQALLTSNSWLFNKDCKLTGGFAVCAWFGGPHKGDVVVTIGGYHPRFKRPDHYPVVPRVGLNWQVSPQLFIKGEAYLAFTPSCGMAGGRLEAYFHATRVTVWFTAYWDVIVNWSPFHFAVDIGVSLRVEVALFLFTVKVTVGVTLKLWGPPVGGFARLEISVITLELPFGAKRDEAKPQPIKSWELFCRSFVTPSEADRKATGKEHWVTPITNASLVSGRSDSAALPAAPKKNEESARKDGVWKVRADELELAASAAVPVTTLNVGRVKTNSPPAGVEQRDPSGNSLLVAKAVELEAEGLKVKPYDGQLGVKPMGKKMSSVLNVTVVRDDGAQARPEDISKWTVEEETASLPAALWDATPPDPNGPSEPTAKLVPNCITGIKRLRPPAGVRGERVAFSGLSWHGLDAPTVRRTDAKQKPPAKTRARDVQTDASAKQDRHKSVADALAALGFDLAWRPASSAVRFRELQDEPLSDAAA